MTRVPLCWTSKELCRWCRAERIVIPPRVPRKVSLNGRIRLLCQILGKVPNHVGRIEARFPHLKKQYWGRHLWARGYFAVTSGNITDEMINEYINEQEGEPVGDDSRFQIDRVVQFAVSMIASCR